MAFAFIWGEQRQDGSYRGLLDCLDGAEKSLESMIEADNGFFRPDPLDDMYHMNPETTLVIEGYNLVNFVTKALVRYQNELDEGFFFKDRDGNQIDLTHIIITTLDRKLVVTDIVQALRKQSYKLLEDY